MDARTHAQVVVCDACGAGVKQEAMQAHKADFCGLMRKQPTPCRHCATTLSAEEVCTC